MTNTDSFSIHDREGLDALPLGAELITADRADDEGNPYTKTEDGYLSSTEGSTAFGPSLFALYEFPMELANPEVLDVIGVGSRVLVDYCRDKGTDYSAFLSWSGPGTVAKVDGIYLGVLMDHDGDQGAFSKDEVVLMDETPGVLLRAGDTVVLVDDDGLAARVGATAIVQEDYREGDPYVRIAWVGDGLNVSLEGRSQMNGSYYANNFRRIAPKVEVEPTPLPAYPPFPEVGSLAQLNRNPFLPATEGYQKGDVVQIVKQGDILGILSVNADLPEPQGIENLWWVNDYELDAFIPLEGWEADLMGYGDDEDVVPLAQWAEGDRVLVNCGYHSGCTVDGEFATIVAIHDGSVTVNIDSCGTSEFVVEADHLESLDETPLPVQVGNYVRILAGASPAFPDLYTESAELLAENVGGFAQVLRAEPDSDGDLYVELGEDGAYVTRDGIEFAFEEAPEVTDRVFVIGREGVASLPFGSVVQPVGANVHYVPAMRLSGSACGLSHANGSDAAHYLDMVLEVLYIHEPAA